MGYMQTRNELSGFLSGIASDEAPVLEISTVELLRQARRFLTGFQGITCYAVKANENSEIIKNFNLAGISTFDVASIHEMQVVRSAAANATLHYHNPVRSRTETAIAYYEYGCRRFAVDHVGELEKLHNSVDNPSTVEVAIRFRLDHASHAVQAFQSKFGATQDQAVELLKRAKNLGFAVGLTFHPGSQTLSYTPYADHIAVASKIARHAELELDFLNVGGGFPSAYAELASANLEQYFSEIDIAAQKHFPHSHPILECEPGRALVARAGTLITTIKAIRHDTNEIFLNDGIYGGLMEVHQFNKLQPVHALVENEHRGEQREWTAYGPTCDPVDALPFKLALPSDITEGDVIRFQGVGAYSTATATRFNGYGSVVTQMV